MPQPLPVAENRGADDRGGGKRRSNWQNIFFRSLKALRNGEAAATMTDRKKDKKKWSEKV